MCVYGGGGGRGSSFEFCRLFLSPFHVGFFFFFLLTTHLADSPRKSILEGSLFFESSSQRRVDTRREFLSVTGSSMRTLLWSIPDF